MGRRQQRRDAEVAAAAAALTREAAIVWRLLARYKKGAEPVYGAPLRCPDCGQFCLVLKVDSREGHCRNRCTHCGFEFLITERALQAVLSGQLPRPEGLVPERDLPIVAPAPTFLTISAALETDGADLRPPAPPTEIPTPAATQEAPAPPVELPTPATELPPPAPAELPPVVAAPAASAGRAATPHHRSGEAARRQRRHDAESRRSNAREAATPTDEVAPPPGASPEPVEAQARADAPPPADVPAVAAPPIDLPALVDAVDVVEPAGIPAFPETTGARRSLFAGPPATEIAPRERTSLFGAAPVPAPAPPPPPIEPGAGETDPQKAPPTPSDVPSDAPAAGRFGAVLVTGSDGTTRLVDPVRPDGTAPTAGARPAVTPPPAPEPPVEALAPPPDPEPVEPVAAASPLARRGPRKAHRPLRILLVEDDPADTALVQALLEAADPGVLDLRVATSRDAGEAAAREYDPHIVLLDLDLPDSHGLATITRWCFADIPGEVVVMSGDYSDSIEERGREQGVADFLPKSVIAELVDEGATGTERVINLLDMVAGRA